MFSEYGTINFKHHSLGISRKESLPSWPETYMRFRGSNVTTSFSSVLMSPVTGHVFIAFVSRLREKKGLGMHVVLNLSNIY